MPRDYGDGYGRRRLIYHPAHIRRLAAAMLREEANRRRAFIEDLMRERETMRAEMRAAMAELHRLQMLDAAQRADLDPFATVH